MKPVMASLETPEHPLIRRIYGTLNPCREAGRLSNPRGRGPWFEDWVDGWRYGCRVANEQTARSQRIHT